jgi:hypothetical protein
MSQKELVMSSDVTGGFLEVTGYDSEVTSWELEVVSYIRGRNWVRPGSNQL